MANEEQASVAVALWGREHTQLDLDEQGPQTDEQLVEYERSAITAMAEMLPLWYQEVGLGGLLSSLVELLKQLDGEAADVEDDDDDNRKARFAIAQHIRLTSMLSRKEVQEAVELVANAK